MPERRHPLHEHWDRVEGELRAALELVRREAHPAGLERAEEYLNHNELGLALEEVVEVVLEQRTQPSRALYEHLERAAADMGMSSSDAWTRFADRFAELS